MSKRGAPKAFLKAMERQRMMYRCERHDFAMAFGPCPLCAGEAARATSRMTPQEPTPEMIKAGQQAVSGFPRTEAIASIWRAMWNAASAIEAATAGETTEIGSTEGESAAPSGETPERNSHDPSE